MPEKAEVFKGSITIAEAENRKMDFELFKEVQEAWLTKKITFEEYISAIRAGGGELTFGELRIKASPSEKATIEGVIQQYKNGELSMHQLRRLISEHGGEAEFWDFELSTHPDYGSEESKIGFLWNPTYSRKGAFMQNVTKRVIEKMLDFVYKSCLKYDKDAFKFSDLRLKSLKTYVESYVIDHISVVYKKDFIRKLVEIGLFVMKEDVYWRVAALRLLNQMPEKYTITAEEISYFNRENPSTKEKNPSAQKETEE